MEYKAKCVFAGTFDPPTIGHKAMIEDCLQMFGETVVAVMVNPGKTPLFTKEERAEMLRPPVHRLSAFFGHAVRPFFCRRGGPVPVPTGSPYWPACTSLFFSAIIRCRQSSASESPPI